MCYLARLLWDVALFFEDVSERCMSAKYWFWDFPGLGGVGDIFSSLEDFFWYIYNGLRKAAFEIDDWWDDIRGLWDDLDDLWDYAHGWLKDTATQAYNWAIWAMDWASQAWNTASAIAGVIGTTFTQIVAFIKKHAEIIYQTINEYVYNTYQTFKEYITNVYETIVENIYNTYQTFKEYITNVYETITNVFNTYVTNIIGVAEDWVRDFVAAALAPFAAPINLINLWFDAIQNFFNDPLGSILSWLGGIARKHENALLSIFDKVMAALWS